MDSLVIANLFLLLFLGLADNQMIAAILPALVKSFEIAVSTAGLLVVVYSLAAAVAAFFSGSALRSLWHGGGSCWPELDSLPFPPLPRLKAQAFNQLILARAMTGLAAGTLSTCSVTFAADWFPV